WFIASVVLLALLIELTPVAILLALITGVAWFMAPRPPGRRDYAVVAAVLLLLLTPTLVWEVVTQGLDFRLLTHVSGGHASISLAFLRSLSNALRAPSAGDLGPASLYARFGAWYQAINLAAALLFATGYLIVSWRVAAPVADAWRGYSAAGGPGRRLVARLL